VIAGIRPEHFEDARFEDRGLRFRAYVDIVESMGSELYAYLDLPNIREGRSDQLDELAAEAGIDEVPGGGATIVARLDAASTAHAGAELELILDTTKIHLFDTDGGRSLTNQPLSTTKALAF
jgi:multiple sugar transport system ATP-binding protein